MIKCQNECPEKKYDGCCHECPHKEGCQSICGEPTPSDSNENGGCGSAIFEGETGLAVFQQQQMAVLQKIADICTAKKKLEEDEKELKEKLKASMEKHGLKSFDNSIIKITYIAATTANSVDSKKLKEKYPEIASECSKASNKSAYVKVEVK